MCVRKTKYTKNQYVRNVNRKFILLCVQDIIILWKYNSRQILPYL